MQDGFFLALRLLALAQNGREPTMGNVSSFVGQFPFPRLAGLAQEASPPLPSSGGPQQQRAMQASLQNVPSMPSPALSAISVSQAQTVPAPPRAAPGGGPPHGWAGSGAGARLTSEEWASSMATFEALDAGGSGLLDGNTCKNVLVQSRLATADLRTIWDLADMTHDGKLDRLEFAVAQHLIRMRQQGGELPLTLPAELRTPPPAAPAIQASTGALSDTARYQLSYSQPGTPMLSAAGTPMPTPQLAAMATPRSAMATPQGGVTPRGVVKTPRGDVTGGTPTIAQQTPPPSREASMSSLPGERESLFNL